MKNIKRFILSLGLSIGLVAPTFGADIQYPGKPFKDSLNVAGKSTNLYAAGRFVTVEGPVLDDCFVIGWMVSVLAPVQRDVEALAGTVLLEKPIGSSVRLTAGHLVIHSSIGADLIGLAEVGGQAADAFQGLFALAAIEQIQLVTVGDSKLADRSADKTGAADK